MEERRNQNMEREKKFMEFLVQLYDDQHQIVSKYEPVKQKAERGVEN